MFGDCTVFIIEYGFFADGYLTAEKDSGIKPDDTDAPSAGLDLPGSEHFGPSTGPITCMPEDWAKPWSNELLRQRIQERAREPGCGGGLDRSEYCVF